MAMLLAACESINSASIGAVRAGNIYPTTSFRHLLHHQTTTPSFPQPPEAPSKRREIPEGQNQMSITLNSSNTRRHHTPMTQASHFSDQGSSSQSGTGLGVVIKAVGAKPPSTFTIPLVIKGNIDQKLHFIAEDPGSVNMVFQIFRIGTRSQKSDAVIGTGMALLKNLCQGLAPTNGRLMREYIIVIVESGSLNSIGTVSFSFGDKFPPLKPV